MANIIRFACMQAEPFLLNVNRCIAAQEVEAAKELSAAAVDTADADEMLASAQDEAGCILAEARKEAERYIHEAEQQAEQVRQQAQEQGRQEGYQQGLQEGRESGLAQMQTQIDDAIVKAQNVLELADKEVNEMMIAAERQIVDIALAVAGKIMACQIEENPMAVLPIVKSALEKVRDQEQIVIRVSNRDFDVVLQAKGDFQNTIGREQALTIVADRTIQEGNCVIDTSYGMVDAKIDTQLDALRKALQEVLP